MRTHSRSDICGERNHERFNCDPLASSAHSRRQWSQQTQLISASLGRRPGCAWIVATCSAGASSYLVAACTAGRRASRPLGYDRRKPPISQVSYNPRFPTVSEMIESLPQLHPEGSQKGGSHESELENCTAAVRRTHWGSRYRPRASRTDPVSSPLHRGHFGSRQCGSLQGSLWPQQSGGGRSSKGAWRSLCGKDG